MLHRYPFGQVEDVSSSVVARSKSQDMHAGMQIPQKNKTAKSGDYIILTKPLRDCLSMCVQFILRGQVTLTLKIEGRGYYVRPRPTRTRPERS